MKHRTESSIPAHRRGLAIVLSGWLSLWRLGHEEGLAEHRVLPGPTRTVYPAVGLRQGPGIHFEQIPGDADAAGL